VLSAVDRGAVELEEATGEVARPEGGARGSIWRGENARWPPWRRQAASKWA
jgi:hypothetical protein